MNSKGLAVLVLGALFLGACSSPPPAPSQIEFEEQVRNAVAEAMAELATPTPLPEATETRVPETPVAPDPTPIVLIIEYPTPTPTPLPAATPAPKRGIGLVRAQPAPLGYAVVLEDETGEYAVKVRLKQVIKHDVASIMLAEAGTEYWPLEETLEYLLVYVETEILRAVNEEQKGMDEFVFDLVTRDGLKFMDARPLLAVPPTPAFSGVGYPGATIEGWVLWAMPKGTQGVVMRMGPYVFDASSAWFSTETPGQMQVLVSSTVDADTMNVILPDGSSDVVQLVSVEAPGIGTDEQHFHLRDPSPENMLCVDRWAKEAAEFARENLTSKSITLEFDSLAGDRDASGRLLAYVLTQDGDFGKTLIKLGYGRVALMGEGGREEARYLTTEVEARQEDMGIWGCES